MSRADAPPLSGLRLFFRVHHWRWVIGSIAVAVGLAYVLGPASLRLSRHAELLPLAAAAMIVPAITVQATLSPFFTARYRVAGRHVRRWMLLHICAATAVTAVLLFACLQPRIGPYIPQGVGAPALFRAMLAYTGAALLTMPVTGLKMAWITPLSWVAVTPVLPSFAVADPLGLLRFHALPDTAVLPWVLAVVLWVGGIGATLVFLKRC